MFYSRVSIIKWIFLAYKVFWVWSYMRGKNFPPWLPGSEESQFLSIFACVHQHSGSRCLSWLGKVCRRISGSLNGTTALGWGVQNSRTEIKCQIIQKILSLIWPKTCFWHLLLLSKVTVSFRALLGELSKGKIKSKSRLSSHRFSKKTNGRIWFVCREE